MQNQAQIKNIYIIVNNLRNRNLNDPDVVFKYSVHILKDLFYTFSTFA